MQNVITPDWPAPHTIQAYTTLRTIDIPGRNRSEWQKITSLLSLPTEPIWVEQTHSDIALPAIPENREQKADATFTEQLNHICLVFTADCLPILICQQDGK